MDLRDTFSSLDASPNKILKIVIGISVILLLMWLLTISQIDYDNDTGQDQQRSVFKTEAAADSTATQADTSQVLSKPVKTSDESSNLLTNGVVTFLVLLVILGGVWIWVDRKAPQANTTNGRQVASIRLDEGAQIKIIRINQEVWVLGVTGSSVNLLHRYSGSEWKEEIRDSEAEDTDLFKKFFKRQMS